MSSREEVLRSLTEAEKLSGHVGGKRAQRHELTYIVDGEYPPGSDPVVERFTKSVERYGAHVLRVPSVRDVPEALEEFIADASSVVFPTGVPPTWIKTAIRDKQVYLDSPETPLPHKTLDEIDAVVTGSTCAIAQTGTIVLDGTGDQGRRALTLIPDTHVVVVDAATVFTTVPEAFRALEETRDRPLTWISGPSATSDIELSRVEGVHGPRKLRIIIAGEVKGLDDLPPGGED